MPREREFDSDQALDRAMQVFWRQGYEQTSFDDLVRETGVSRYGLYAAFGDKKALFLQALQNYAQMMARMTQSELREEDASLPGILAYFENLKGLARTETMRNGCLLSTTTAEIAASDPEIHERVTALYDNIREVFRAALVRAAERDEIEKPEDFDALALALVSTMQGLATLHRADYRMDQADALIDTLTTCLLKPKKTPIKS
ncbi:MAG: TetR/AcrR family transcriptional regulator [Magnetovibrionaceae bacterium]